MKDNYTTNNKDKNLGVIEKNKQNLAKSQRYARELKKNLLQDTL